MAIKVFKKGYPYVNALYQLSILAHYIGYLYNKTPFYSPWLRLIGIEIKRMSAADYVSYSTISDVMLARSTLLVTY